MRLVLLSPDKSIFDGEVESVTIPGTKGLFTVLPHHAPLVSTIDKGVVTFKAGSTEQNIRVADGFVEIKNNVVHICIEKVLND